MTVEDFDFELPEELIAQVPLEPRDASRLLHLHRATGAVAHRKFHDVVEILAAGDLLVFNDTRVTALRIFGRKGSGAKVEALVLRPEDEGHLALTKPAKKLRTGDKLVFEDRLTAEVVQERDGGLRVLKFLGSDASAVLTEIGETPLPPYIHEKLKNPERYQTVLAKTPGSAAAPTAGLHFTEDTLGRLRAKGVKTATVTLDVGLDTFRPISVSDLADHKMLGERCSASSETAEQVRHCRGRIVAVGTTSVRTLETLATGHRQLEPGERVSNLFVTPGFEFKVIDGMFTNFHLPRTTMLMMVAALVGRDALMRAYHEAIVEQYRFLSFGDSMLAL
ncbi:MAG: tRNA preQ1(34) S-adenosylmethionine ribosyltransferase-isomerase QueA [Fimbriimonadaceae bacterium]|nr:tRNA preQ1(34) S-adenosylmethionine ribosyltransferase-isomerase QueA [Fimbriimonadaceae bacterium]QYK57597.1 MAG: tRNA preQ1(34) S-adenosylmethionine ribosyltransferase-isomerase QueA [Fimbriimonadaceae bacterium]